MMKVIEKKSVSKKGDDTGNEDRIYLGNRFIAVIDGVTSKSGKPSSTGQTGGSFASETLCQILEHFNEDVIDPVEIVKSLNDELKNAVKVSVFSSQKEPPAASVILYDAKTHQVISYGDCQMLYRGKCYRTEKQLDRIYAEKRSEILHEYLEKGFSMEMLLKDDPGRNQIKEDLLNHFLLYANQKKEFGFPVIGIDEIVLDYLCVVSIEQNEEVVFASDGYPYLYSELDACEEALKQLLEKDPLLMRDYRSTKGLVQGNASFDDRSFVRFMTD